MKQFFGYVIASFSLVLLIFISKNILLEVNAIKDEKETIANSVELDTVASDMPITLVDRNNNVFSEEYVEWRQPLPLDKIPTIAQKLFILSEDEQFYTHIGFNVSAIARAVVINSNEASSQQGGSTITQQLVRMRYLTTDKTYERKIMELFYAYELEQEFSKDQILEMYLNEAYFSNQVYGLGSAATFYFSKPIRELTPAELAFIAAIPNNPSLYDPVKHFDQTKARQERLLDKLVEKKEITAEEGKNLKAEQIVLNIKKKVQKYPAYSTYVLAELRELIANNAGYEATSEQEQATIDEKIDDKVNVLLQSGATIYTALDAAKQEQDEAAINQILANVDFQASSTVIDNQSREIVSVFAGKNYQKHDFHRAFQAPRQPGSAFKPIAAYAPFFNETGYDENYVVSGGPYCVYNYCPTNYKGGKYGDVTVKTAMQYSYNTSALRLVSRIGLDKAFSYINQFPFKSVDDSDKNFAATLGGLKYGVTTSELADAYTSFIDGSYKTAHTIRKVVDANGNVLYSWPNEPKQIWSAKTVQTMRTMLAAVVQNGTGKGLYTSSNYIGAKTGTTNDYNDLWLAGLTDHYTAAVWTGYDKPASMERYENDKIHFAIFNQIMD